MLIKSVWTIWNIIWAQVDSVVGVLLIKKQVEKTSWPLKLKNNKSNLERKRGCCACGKVEPLCVFENENTIINLITNIGAVNQVNEAHKTTMWKQPALQYFTSTLSLTISLMYKSVDLHCNGRYFVCTWVFCLLGGPCLSCTYITWRDIKGKFYDFS